MVSVGWAHLYLTFVPWLPLIVLCLDELLVRQRGSPIRWGAALGLLAIAQFFTSPEILANTAQLCLVGLLILTIAHRDKVGAKLRYAATGLATAAGVASVALVYPTWYAFFGPQHVKITVPAQLYSADLVGPIVPTSNQLLSTSGLRHLGDRLCGFLIQFAGRLYELTGAAYLGIPLIVILAVVVVRCRRQPRVRFFAAMTLVAFVASLGPTLKVAGHVTGVPLPGRLWQHLPLLSAIFPFRFGLFVFLGAAVLLAVGLDELHRRTAGRNGPRSASALLPSLVGLAALLPLVPVWPYTAAAIQTPPYFRSSAISSIPAGRLLVTYPFPAPISAETMIWQAENDMRYRMAGGYALVPGPGKGFILIAGPGATRDVLVDLLYDRPPRPVTPQLVDGVQRDLQKWHAYGVVVVRSWPRSDEAVSLFTSVLGGPPREDRGVAVWSPLPYASVGRAP